MSVSAERDFIPPPPSSQQEAKKEKEPPRFQLSSLSPQERIDYSHLIEELGESSTQLAMQQQKRVKHITCLQLLIPDDISIKRICLQGMKTFPSEAASCLCSAVHIQQQHVQKKCCIYCINIYMYTLP